MEDIKVKDSELLVEDWSQCWWVQGEDIRWEALHFGGDGSSKIL